MEIKLEVPNYDKTNGLKCNWENGFEIEVQDQAGAIRIIANKEGLQSLANHLLNLAQDEVPKGYHLHFDQHNSLVEGSLELIIEKSVR